MDFRKATKQQLMTIIYEDDCPMTYKLQAAQELDKRRREKVARFQQRAVFSGKSYRVTI